LKLTYRMEERYKFNAFGLFGPAFSRETVMDGGSRYTKTLFDSDFDVGGGIEIVPTRRLALRLDFSDRNGLFSGGLGAMFRF
jgi:hypothetical protein